MLIYEMYDACKFSVSEPKCLKIKHLQAETSITFFKVMY